ncbi:hypothetical protein K439DRAFT_1614725 [Ramaria rubella]|nr:hypothetical protein K439DRAFT_1614725 [Ramaria rubella]
MAALSALCATTMELDVTDISAIRRVREEVAAITSRRLDILINNTTDKLWLDIDSGIRITGLLIRSCPSLPLHQPVIQVDVFQQEQSLHMRLYSPPYTAALELNTGQNCINIKPAQSTSCHMNTTLTLHTHKTGNKVATWVKLSVLNHNALGK